MFVTHQFLSASLEYNPSVFQNIGPMAHAQGLFDVLLDQEDGYSFFIDPLEYAKDVLNQDGGKP